MAFLQVINASYTLSKKQLVKHANFQVLSGQVVVFLGPNGAGKTTLLRAVMGLVSLDPGLPEDGIYIDQHNITKSTTAERIKFGIVYLPQHSSLFNQMSLHDNLELIFEYHDAWKTKSRADFVIERDAWLTKVGLENRFEQKATTLSGGQKRKLEIVRAALMQPKILLLDEPFAGVDPKSIYELKDIFAAMAASGIGIVISDHNVDQLLSIADLVYVIMNGEVISSGSVQEILAHKKTQDLYFGNQFYREMNDKFSDIKE